MNTKERVTGAASTVKPYVDRAIHDEDLRVNLRNAFAAARDVYDELVPPRDAIAVARRVATDKDIQDSLRRAVEELRVATDRVQGRAEESHAGRKTFFLLTGITVAILFNPVTGPDTRKWLKDTLFGGSGDFGYEPSPDLGTNNN
jgi:hypothetical protein